MSAAAKVSPSPVIARISLPVPPVIVSPDSRPVSVIETVRAAAEAELVVERAPELYEGGLEGEHEDDDAEDDLEDEHVGLAEAARVEVLRVVADLLSDPRGSPDVRVRVAHEPEEEVERTQEAVNSLEVNVELFPSLKIIDESQVDPSLIRYNKPNESAILLEVKELHTKDWLVGDKFSITIPHTGYVLETQIEEVRELAPGVTAIKSYPDETMANHILLTVSEKSTFMSLFTPDGEYELIGGQEYGWLASSRLLGGPTADDAVVIEQVRDVIEAPRPKNPAAERE